MVDVGFERVICAEYVVPMLPKCMIKNKSTVLTVIKIPPRSYLPISRVLCQVSTNWLFSVFTHLPKSISSTCGMEFPEILV